MHNNPDVTSCPEFLPDTVQRSWASLNKSTQNADTTFDPDSIGALPVPVARWLRHTIAPGTPLRVGVQVSMHGTIRIKKWMPFTAQQIVASTGYIWAAEAGRFPIKVQGYDRYSDNTGHMSWKLLGTIPLVNATGTDIDRSAAGRLASEMIGLTPAGALGPNVTWAAIDDYHAVATIIIDKQAHVVTIDVDDNGILKSVVLPRWAKPDKEPYQLHTFGVICDGEFSTGGYTLSRHFSAGWWPGTPKWEQGEFFRATLDEARFFTTVG